MPVSNSSVPLSQNQTAIKASNAMVRSVSSGNNLKDSNFENEDIGAQLKSFNASTDKSSSQADSSSSQRLPSHQNQQKPQKQSPQGSQNIPQNSLPRSDSRKHYPTVLEENDDDDSMQTLDRIPRSTPTGSNTNLTSQTEIINARNNNNNNKQPIATRPIPNVYYPSSGSVHYVGGTSSEALVPNTQPQFQGAPGQTSSMNKQNGTKPWVIQQSMLVQRTYGAVVPAHSSQRDLPNLQEPNYYNPGADAVDIYDATQVYEAVGFNDYPHSKSKNAAKQKDPLKQKPSSQGSTSPAPQKNPKPPRIPPSPESSGTASAVLSPTPNPAPTPSQTSPLQPGNNSKASTVVNNPKNTKSSLDSGSTATDTKKRRTEQTLTLQTSTAELSVPGFLEVDPNNDYKILKRVAKGGEAAIYRCEVLTEDLKDRADRGAVAAKVFSGEVDERRRLAMAQEVALMWYLRDCPQVAKIVGFSSDPPVILMKYYAYGSLKNFLEKGGIMRSKRTIMRIMKDVTLGIQKMHTSGIVHADIKARNHNTLI